MPPYGHSLNGQSGWNRKKNDSLRLLAKCISIPEPMTPFVWERSKYRTFAGDGENGWVRLAADLSDRPLASA